MKLIDEWKKAYRMLSVQAMGLALAVQGAWPTMPEDLKARLPSHLVYWVSALLLVAGIVGRLVRQDALKPKVDE